MGQRCNLIIVEDGAFKLYYDHWAANRLDDELFWGPETARAFIEQRDEDPNAWLDEVWSEGGCVLDFDARRLTWYGGEDILYDPSLNLAHAELMATQWDGWTVEWAYDGIFDLARRVGVAREVVSSGKPFDPEYQLTLPTTKTAPALGERFLYADAVVSNAKGDRRRFGVLAGYLESLAHRDMTEDQLCSLVDGFDPDRFLADVADDPGWGPFRWGADLDLDQREMRLWYSEAHEGLLDHLMRHWRDWTISFTGSDYLWHADLLPMLPWPAPQADLKLMIIKGLRTRLGKSHPNPAVSTVEALKKTSSNVKVNPSVFKNREHPAGRVADKRAVLDALEAAVSSEMRET